MGIISFSEIHVFPPQLLSTPSYCHPLFESKMMSNSFFIHSFSKHWEPFWVARPMSDARDLNSSNGAPFHWCFFAGLFPVHWHLVRSLPFAFFHSTCLWFSFRLSGLFFVSFLHLLALYVNVFLMLLPPSFLLIPWYIPGSSHPYNSYFTLTFRWVSDVHIQCLVNTSWRCSLGIYSFQEPHTELIKISSYPQAVFSS